VTRIFFRHRGHTRAIDKCPVYACKTPTKLLCIPQCSLADTTKMTACSRATAPPDLAGDPAAHARGHNIKRARVARFWLWSPLVLVSSLRPYSSQFSFRLQEPFSFSPLLSHLSYFAPPVFSFLLFCIVVCVGFLSP
jgi:hypothetical protein